MSEQQPYVGLTVHYTTRTCTDGAPRAECHPATVTALFGDDLVALAVPNRPEQVTGVPHVEIVDKIEPGPSGRSDHTWHWQECA